MTTGEDVMVLHRFGPDLGVRDPNPFCLKLETWLGMADLDCRTVAESDPRKGPRGGSKVRPRLRRTAMMGEVSAYLAGKA